MIDMIKLAPQATLMQYKAEEVIVKTGPSDNYSMFFVLAGSAVEYSDYGTKNQTRVKEHGYGDMFGELNLFLDIPSQTTIVAAENITLIAVNREKYEAICQKNPDSAFEIANEICSRLLAATKNSNHHFRLANVAMKRLGTSIKEFSNQLLFPAEHKVNDMKEPDAYQTYVAPYKLTCPNCSAEFESRTTLTSKLRPISTVQQRADLRQRYHDFDTSWYDIVSCPHCIFSAQMVYFTKYVSIAKNAYAEKLSEIKASVNPTFTYPKTLDQVFSSYYIAMICADGFEVPSQIRARLWLQLSWIYEDLAQDEMLKIAQKNALDNYMHFYSTTSLDPVSTQVCCLIMGSLAGKLGEYEQALQLLSKAKAINDGKPVYKITAEREADVVRDAHRQAK